MSEADFTHLDARGRARMVDVTPKAETARHARAEGRIRLLPSTVEAFTRGRLAKGDAAALARAAGIQGAKRTADLIPLCHPLRLSRVDVAIDPDGAEALRVVVDVAAVDRTGVEMEALVGVSSALLTIYDMVKAVDRGAVIEDVRLLLKSGGRSGTWEREVEGEREADA